MISISYSLGNNKFSTPTASGAVDGNKKVVASNQTINSGSTQLVMLELILILHISASKLYGIMQQ